MRVRIDGTQYELDDVPALDKKKNHEIDIVVDRIVIKPGIQQRLNDSIETALKQSGGLMASQVMPDGEITLFSQNYACPDCGISIEELTPRMFSFNNPYGACPTCYGLGHAHQDQPDLMIAFTGRNPSTRAPSRSWASTARAMRAMSPTRCSRRWLSSTSSAWIPPWRSCPGYHRYPAVRHQGSQDPRPLRLRRRRHLECGL